jgi:hypothetical protein
VHTDKEALVRTSFLRLGACLPWAGVALNAAGLGNRTFVAANKGSDTGFCPPTAPCQTLAYALTQTAPDGEVILVESGEYGTATITQSVSVSVTPGIYAGITASGFGSLGVYINAGASAVVVLRGLTFVSVGAYSGIRVDSAGGSTSRTASSWAHSRTGSKKRL